MDAEVARRVSQLPWGSTAGRRGDAVSVGPPVERGREAQNLDPAAAHDHPVADVGAADLRSDDGDQVHVSGTGRPCPSTGVAAHLRDADLAVGAAALGAGAVGAVVLRDLAAAEGELLGELALAGRVR